MVRFFGPPCIIAVNDAMWQPDEEDSSGMYCASRCQDQPTWYLTGLQREEVEDGAGQSGHGGIHLQRICERWVSVAVALVMRLEVLPVTVHGVPDGDNWSPSVPGVTGGHKSK